MHFLGVLGVGPRFLPHALYGVGIQLTNRVERLRVETAPPHHGLRPALLERRVVEERIGLRHQDAPGESGGLWRVNGHPLDRPVLESTQDREKSIDVHRLVEAVFHRLPNQRVIHRHRQVTRRQCFAARHRLWKTRRQ